MTSTCRGVLFRQAARALDERGLRLCMLHGAQEYPDRLSSDLDAVCAAPTLVPHVLARHTGLDIVQVLEHEQDAYYYVLHGYCGSGSAFAALDVSADYRRNGRIFFTRAQLLEDRRSMDDLDRPNPGVEFACYLVKRLLKAELQSDHERELTRLFRADPDSSRREIERFFTGRDGRMIQDAARTGAWAPVEGDVARLRGVLLSAAMRRDRLSVVRYWLADLRRRVDRLRRPTGLSIVFHGSNRSRNAAIIDGVAVRVAPAFRRTTQQRSRLRRMNRVKRLGEKLRRYPLLVRSSLVLVDGGARSNGVGAGVVGGLSLNRALERLAAPDLTIYVGESAVAHRTGMGSSPPGSPRETDLSHRQLGRQARYFVDGSRELQDIIREVEHIIIGYLVQRTAGRLKIVAPN